ncbi:MAG: DUF255 domain-containing protein [Planctomycetaceae bacterium]|nr:DUF255 domain-containing protein [Planctomycetaceae bacterium]
MAAGSWIARCSAIRTVVREAAMGRALAERGPRLWPFCLTVLSMVLLGLPLALDAAEESSPSPAQAGGKHRNHLANSTSPYLRQHAGNPVNWYPWGPEALQRAKDEDKLIFLSVGYSSCYWCHVMERKVFENEEIAAKMNENFICIKVDREERPDIDEIYMTSLIVYQQAIGQGGGGGWPLSMFLTPNGQPLAGGTYFPPEDTEGAFGFPTVMSRLLDIWKARREQLEGNAEILATETRRLLQPGLALKPVVLDSSLVAACATALAESADPEAGGFDFRKSRPEGPKFPVGVKLLFAQDWLGNKSDDALQSSVTRMLRAMALGGLQDHLGGGFHRYSVDRNWKVPHFEKMLYDQGLLLKVYAREYARTKDPLFLEAASGIVRFIDREMTSPEGVFWTALDAETNTIEGEYYVWSLAQVQEALPDDEEKVFVAAYNMVEAPDFEHGNVLRRVLSDEDLSREFNIPVERVASQLAEARGRLLALRGVRPRPLLDDKILLDWNSLMIRGLAEAGVACEKPDWISRAAKAADWFLNAAKAVDGELRHSWSLEGQSPAYVFLDDYAYFIAALLDLHDATGDRKWLDAAVDLQQRQDDKFRQESGAYAFSPDGQEKLIASVSTAYDSHSPAGNSVSARNLVRLARLLENNTYRTAAARVLKTFAHQLEESPRSSCALAAALRDYLAEAPSAEPRTSSVRRTPIHVVSYAVQEEETAGKEPVDVYGKEMIRVRAYLSTDRLPAGGTSDIAVVIDVKPGWHIQANPPSPENMIATEVKLVASDGVELTNLVFPMGAPHTLPEFEVPVSVYDNRVIVRGKVTVPASLAGKTEELRIDVKYQACNEESCRPPRTVKLVGKVPVANPGEMVKSINQKLFAPETAAP